jgi:hypothetical protein
VNDDGEVCLGGDLELGTKYFVLIFLMGKIVVIIQTGLADRENLFVGACVFEIFEIGWGDVLCVMRVIAQSRPEAVVLICQGQNLVNVRSVCANGYPFGNAGCDASRKDGVDVVQQFVES